MDRFHVIKHPLGGSDVFDADGKQVGYSLPSIFGDGEDFYDMNGNPAGQSFDDGYGSSDFIGSGNGVYGYMDREIMMGRNAWLQGDPFGKNEDPGFSGIDSFDSGADGFDSPDDFGPDF